MLCGAVGVGLLVVTILAGYLGSGTALDNWAPTFLLITFWVGLVFASILFGDIYRAFSPFRAIGRLLPSLNRPYPERFGRWPAAVGCCSRSPGSSSSRGWGENPAMLVTAALGYTVLTLAAQYVWGVETWTRNGEAFAVYFNLFARLSIFETRDGVVGVRRPLGGLPRLDPVPGTVAFVTVMIGTVTFDGLSQGQLWQDVSADVVDALDGLGIGALTAHEDRGHVRPAARRRARGRLLPARDRGRALGRRRAVVPQARVRLHPLAGPDRRRLRGRPLPDVPASSRARPSPTSPRTRSGRAGTCSAPWTRASTTTVFPQEDAWYVQVAVVVVGHVAALMLAHDRALVLYATRASRCARSTGCWA